DLVGEDVSRRPQRERGHRTGADRHGGGRDLLRRAGRGSTGVSLQGFYIAATVVALVQWLRLRDRRILALLAMFALLAIGHSPAPPARVEPRYPTGRGSRP